MKRLGYKFKNKNISLVMDCGPTPNSKYTRDYQAGTLSFEIISNGKKLISNCGYYKKTDTTLNKLSKSTATAGWIIEFRDLSFSLSLKTILETNFEFSSFSL